MKKMLKEVKEAKEVKLSTLLLSFIPFMIYIILIVLAFNDPCFKKLLNTNPCGGISGLPIVECTFEYCEPNEFSLVYNIAANGWLILLVLINNILLLKNSIICLIQTKKQKLTIAKLISIISIILTILIILISLYFVFI